MKRIFLTMSLFAALAVVMTSCLKDKGFDNGLYGINDPDTQPPGVGFPLSSKANNKNTGAVNVSTTIQAINGIVYVSLLTGAPAASDVHVTIAVNDALRVAYNAANNPDLEVLTAAQFSLATTVTIPAGARNAEIPLNITNSSLLDPNKAYGLGITITGVDGGYTIANNLKNLLVEITVKNQYHGTYHSIGYFYHPASPRAMDMLKDATTSGASSVDIDLGDLGSQGYRYRATVDPITNNLTLTPAPGAAGAPYTQMNAGLPTTAPGYTAAWAGSALCNNTYNPANRTFYVRIGYVGGTGWRVSEEHNVRQ
jgi:Domain of unknown function (DUF1735)